MKDRWFTTKLEMIEFAVETSRVFDETQKRRLELKIQEMKRIAEEEK